MGLEQQLSRIFFSPLLMGHPSTRVNILSVVTTLQYRLKT